MTARRIILALTVLAMLPGGFTSCGKERLLLRYFSREQGKVLKEYAVKPGDRFFLSYIHSSEKTPISDEFVIGRGGEILLVEERFRWYAVGLEAHGGYDGAQIQFDGPITRVRLNRVFPTFRLRVGWVADQVLACQGEEVRLSSIARGGELLEISVVHVR